MTANRAAARGPAASRAGFGGLTAVDNVDLDVAQGEFRQHHRPPTVPAKTTLFQPRDRARRSQRRHRTAGTAATSTRLAAERLATLGIARTFQHGRVFANLSVLDNVLVGAPCALQGGAAVVARVRSSCWNPLAETGGSPWCGPARSARRKKRNARGGPGDPGPPSATGCCPRKDNPAYSLSYANRRRVEIARAPGARPPVSCLLDEPTAGMKPDRDGGDAGSDRPNSSSPA